MILGTMSLVPEHILLFPIFFNFIFMKRFFLWMLVIGVVCSSLQAFATESPIQKIYKIESYKWDEINGVYDYIWHGSAVLIGKNKIITNAHVILGEDDLPTGNYNLCISDSFETAPKCKTSLKLLQYDKTNDLAILEPTKNLSLGTPVETSTKKLELWEAVKVYGYPANGGETITLTEGKVSGLDNGHYKIDANIDAGNSWGGTFDKDGKFIGIPYIASVGYSTLGYIIPISMVQDFIAWKGDIIKYTKIEEKFIKYIDKNNAALLTQKIDNPYIGFDNFQKYGFTLKKVDEKWESVLSNYTLYSKTLNTSISLWLDQIYGKVKIGRSIDLDKLKEKFSTVVEKKDITLGGKKINKMVALVWLKKDDGTVDKNFVSLSFNLSNGLSYIIETQNYGAEKKALNSAISLFVKNLQIKKEIPLLNKVTFTNIPASFDVIPDMNVRESFDGTNFIFDSSVIQNGAIIISKMFDKEWDESLGKSTLEELVKKTAKSYDTYMGADNDIQIEIKKNALWMYYSNMIITKKKTGEVTYGSDFFTKVGKEVYNVSIGYWINKPDADLEKKYFQFIDTINLTWTFPYKSASVGKINIEDETGTWTTTSASGSTTVQQ